jgi:outer membrane protein OmpA-like peptidoglycan-associated protein
MSSFLQKHHDNRVNLMNKTGWLAILLILLAGCACKESLIVLTPDAGGQVGAIQLKHDGENVVLEEEGKALLIADSSSGLVPVSEAETQDLFRDALSAQPLAPQSYLLYFKFGTENLTAESRHLIDAILKSIQERDSQDISVVGHTDRAGDHEYNLALALKRATSVRDLLVEQGVPADFIQLSSHGEGNPLVPTADNVAEAKNRRVEVMVR